MSTPETSVEPFGMAGPDTDRDASGRFTKGNRAAVIVGQHSAVFWGNVAATVADRVGARLKRYGFEDATSAPDELRSAITAEVQATIVRDSAFERMVESGGPVTGKDRRRSTYRIWREAVDAADHAARSVVHVLDALKRHASDDDRPKTLTAALQQAPVLGDER